MNYERDKIIDRFAKYVSPGKAELYTKFNIALVPGRRNGCYIYDVNGKKYINCHSNGGVFNLGHRNPLIIKALKDAMRKYDIGNHHLISGPRGLLAEMIADSMPSGLNRVVFGVSGGEAVDLAIKLARGVTGRSGIISARGGYHGHTGLALAAGDKKFKDKFKPLAPGFKQVKFNSLEELEKTVSEKTAAVIFETIPATMGIVVPDKNFFKGVRKICDKSGALLIVDEVQTGLGRTGKLWAFENYMFKPDIVVIGKGLSGGIYPVTATVYHEKFAYFFKEDPFVHISTFGGSEAGCFTAMKVMELSSDKRFLENVSAMGRLLKEEIISLSEKYPDIKIEPKGVGLMMGLEFENDLTALSMMKKFFENGLYLLYSGNDPRVLQFLPPLIIDKKVSFEIIKKIERSLKNLR